MRWRRFVCDVAVKIQDARRRSNKKTDTLIKPKLQKKKKKK